MTTSYFDVWKKKMDNNGGSITQSKLNSSKNFYNNNFTEDPSYKLAILRKKDTTILDSDLDTRVVNVDTDTYKKKIYVRPNTNIESGDYIIYPNKTYLALTVEDNLISPCANGTFCNYILKWMIDGQYYELPAIVSNNTKYTLGISTQVSGITEGSGMFGAIVSFNDSSKNIPLGERFIVNGQAWEATQLDHSSVPNVLSILLGESSKSTEFDDMENEIADKYLINHTYTYSIPLSFEVTKDNNYTLVYSIKDETGADIDYSLVTISTTDASLVELTNTNGVITIKGLSAGTGNIKLTSTLGSETKEFNIAFEVKETVANQVDYQYSFSQPITSLKQYVTTTLTTSKLINGVIDNTLQISYSFDTNTQTLISQGKIVVTVKSLSSISIKNASISTPTDIYLTVSDVSDSTKILDAQKITLTGM